MLFKRLFFFLPLFLLFLASCAPTTIQRGASSENLVEDKSMDYSTSSTSIGKKSQEPAEVLEIGYKEAVELMLDVAKQAFPNVEPEANLVEKLDMGSDLIVTNRDFWRGDVKLTLTAEVVQNLDQMDEYGIIFKAKAAGYGSNFSMIPGYASEAFFKNLDILISERSLNKKTFTNYKILKDKGITEKVSASIPTSIIGFKKYIDEKSDRKPFEGIWASGDGKYTVGLIHTPKDYQYKYKAFILESKYRNWEAGEVKFKLMKLRNGKLTSGILHLKSKVEHSGTWKADKELLEHISEPKGMYIKQYPDGAFSESDDFINGVGTGWAVSDKGIFVTNHHVIDGADKIYVGFKDSPSPARVLLSDKRIDLAVVEIINPKKKYKPLKISTNNVGNGTEIMAVGYPLAFTLGDDPRVHEGVISAQSGIDKDITRYQISANINPGNSGGPVIAKNGNVVAVSVEKLNEGTGVNFAIKANYVESLLNQLNIPINTSGSSEDSFAEVFNEYKGSILPIWTER